MPIGATETSAATGGASGDSTGAHGNTTPGDTPDTPDAPGTAAAANVASGEGPRRAARAGQAQVQARRPQRDHRRAARIMFHAHLWFGVATTAMLLVIALTGVALNHKRGLGIMPDVEHTPSGEFSAALPLARLAELAAAAVDADVASAGVDRMDVRPGDGLIKVRFDDRAVTEVTLDVVSGEVLHVGARGDVFFEKLHSGEIMGKRWVLLSDLAALGLVIALVSGIWLWLYPKSRL